MSLPFQKHASDQLVSIALIWLSQADAQYCISDVEFAVRARQRPVFRNGVGHSQTVTSAVVRKSSSHLAMRIANLRAFNGDRDIEVPHFDQPKRADQLVRFAFLYTTDDELSHSGPAAGSSAAFKTSQVASRCLIQ